MRQYMVLSDLAAKPATRGIRTRSWAGPFESFQVSARTAPPPQPNIEVQGMSPHEAADVRRKPGFTSIAPIMPTSLIHPFSEAAADAQEVWGLAAVKADTSRFTGDGVTVAVLDTGIDQSHAAFAGMQNTIVQNDFTATGNGDGQGHGTHCAGTIFGREVEGKRIGIAPGVTKA